MTAMAGPVQAWGGADDKNEALHSVVPSGPTISSTWSGGADAAGGESVPASTGTVTNSTPATFGPKVSTTSSSGTFSSKSRQQTVVLVHYKQDSCIAAFAASRQFECVTLSVICANAIWLGTDTDLNKAKNLKDTEIGWRIGENIFCVYFTVEILIRFAAFKDKLLCWRDRWFVFDSLLVVLMVVETWIMPLFLSGESGNPLSDLGVLRLLRLLRLSRLARLMRSVPELVTIVKGIVAATRSVGTVFLFLIVLDYVFAIVFTGTYKPVAGTEYSDLEVELQTYFGNLGMSMFSLFCHGTLLDDLAGLVTALRLDSVIMLSLLILFILISSFTVLNMLIGILCDVVAQTEEEESERTKREMVRDTFQNVFSSIDKDGSGRVSAAEFDAMCKDASVLRILEQKLNIDPRALTEMRQLLFTDASGNREMTFDDFLKLLIRLRPDEKAGPLDVQQFRKVLRDQERRCLHKTGQLFQQVRRIKETKFGDGSSSLSPRGAAAQTLEEDSNAVQSFKPADDGLAKLCAEATAEEIMEELQYRLERGIG